VSLRLVALVVPLALDTFAVCAALAAGGLTQTERRRVGGVVVAFEAAMPLVGLLLGRGASAAAGGAADWIGLGCLVAVGGWLLFEGEETTPAAGLRVGALLALGVAVSIDELAIGFSFGLLRISIVWAVVLIAAQAIVAAQLGFALGARASLAREWAGRLAGAALLLVALVLVLRRSG
jgi:putative Mn2+ efflux pump MntP